MRYLLTLLCAFAFTACGFNTAEDFSRRVAQAQTAQGAEMLGPLAGIATALQAWQPMSDAEVPAITPDQLFDWAEATYPQLFPTRESTLRASVYQFRYYKATDIYLAVESGVRVVALGRPTGNQIASFGTLSDFSALVRKVVSPGFYAASRFLEQAAFGPTPEAVAQVQTLGLAKWIDGQMALPPTQIDWSGFNYPDTRALPADARYFFFQQQRVMDAFVGGADQLRLRTTWALSNFVVVSSVRVQPVGIVEYFNHLQRYALGGFDEFIRMLIRNASMALYLDNIENRTGCPECQINENFARELLQLFTIGTAQLNADGTMKRDAQNRPVDAFTQRDVRELARALTGWVYDNAHVVQVANWGSNSAGYEKPMKPTLVWHDTGPKTILGVALPGGQTAEKDLESVVSIIFQHPNVGPFIARRLIQALVTSDPSPQYIERVAGIFANDGTGRRGNIAAVVRAILLDPDARAGDTGADAVNGRIKEPLLVATSLMRGLGCKFVLERSAGYRFYGAFPQTPFSAPTVFGFTSPDYRVPGSNLNAPEQKLINDQELSNFRLGGSGVAGWYDFSGTKDKNFLNAACGHAEFGRAIASSTDEFINLISQRFYRGRLPAVSEQPLRKAIAIAKARGQDPDPTFKDPVLQSLFVLNYVSATGGFGVVR